MTQTKEVLCVPRTAALNVREPASEWHVESGRWHCQLFSVPLRRVPLSQCESPLSALCAELSGICTLRGQGEALLAHSGAAFASCMHANRRSIAILKTATH
jgi:hypothetical protein